jgi:hypothetical protein
MLLEELLECVHKSLVRQKGRFLKIPTSAKAVQEGEAKSRICSGDNSLGIQATVVVCSVYKLFLEWKDGARDPLPAASIAAARSAGLGLAGKDLHS